jgi:hypothetical protein
MASLVTLVLVVLGLLPAKAWAVTIHFDDLPAGFCVPNPQCSPVPDSILSNDLAGLGVVFGRSGQSAGAAVIDGTRVNVGPSSFPNTIVGLDSAGNIPSNFTGSIFFGFFLPGTGVSAVTDFVSFTLGDGGGDADSFQIRTFGLDDELLSSFIRPVDTSEVGRFPVEVGVMGIHRIEIVRLVGQGTQFGYSLDDLAFSPVQSIESPLATPEPATWMMLISGLGGCLALKRYSGRGTRGNPAPRRRAC